MSLVGALLGSYRITDELSSGGMGTIYRARHELLGRDAAVKVLRAELTSDAELVDRFFTEARAATAIRHPSIIEVFDFGYTETGEAYLVMEFLEGETLHARLKAFKPAGLPPQQAAHFARGLANALVAAHAKGILHRDLKPANIFLVPDAEQPYGVRVKILDFGIAKLVDPTGQPLGRSHTIDGALIGTPRYMAPEQARSAKAIDHRADLYSLGCILYEMVVGEAPFPRGGSGEVIAMHLFEEVQPPRDRVPGLSPELDAIILRLLQKDPADRFASAQEVARALAVPAGIETTPSPFTPVTGPQLPLARPSVETHITPFDEGGPTRRDRSLKLPILAAVAVLVIGGVVAVVVAQGSGDDKPVAAPAVTEPVPMQVTPPSPAPPPVPAVVVPPAPVVVPPAATPLHAPAHTVTPHTHEPPVKVTPKQPTCDPKDGAHTSKCAPIETTP
ncbi:MAG TPA: serine/threonine-protein kinase [Kofleriaceae bacterium]|nr:serine/threonine-protein kinase [Kofleriaceae bacterium]